MSTRTSRVPCQVKAFIDPALPQCRETDRPDGRENRESDIGDLEELVMQSRDPGSATRMRIGLFLSSEEFGPRELVDLAAARSRPASAACGSPTTSTRGTTQQGHSPFVWSVIGAIAAGDRVCRSAPASPARRCASIPRSSPRRRRRARVMLEGRFTLGVGSGEALNEHILGDAVAGRRRAPRDARGGGRGHARAVDGRRQRPPRDATTAWRPPASTTCPTSRRR